MKSDMCASCGESIQDNKSVKCKSCYRVMHKDELCCDLQYPTCFTCLGGNEYDK